VARAASAPLHPRQRLDVGAHRLGGAAHRRPPISELGIVARYIVLRMPAVPVDAWCAPRARPRRALHQTFASATATEALRYDCSGLGRSCPRFQGKARSAMHAPPLLSSRRKLSVIAVVGAVVLGSIGMLGAEIAPSAGAAASSRVHRCATSRLVIWLNEVPGNGAAGSVFHQLGFTNLSKRTCTLRGYPRVRGANLHGGRVGGFATREASGTLRTVRLHAGESAFATLRIVEAQNFPHSACHPVTVAGLRVSPPGRHSSKLVPLPFEACARVSNPNLAVRAVEG
jgi:Domain of unknown function (DUF4232)